MPMPGSQVDIQQDPNQPQKPGIGHRILGIAGGALQRFGGQQPQPMPMTPAPPAMNMMSQTHVFPRQSLNDPSKINPAFVTNPALRIQRPIQPQPPTLAGAGNPLPPSSYSPPPGAMPPQPGQRPMIRRPFYPGITPAAQNISDEQGNGAPQY